jgi:2,3-diketo-5-methylthio-1-phosphopentane phosphatase
VYKVYCDFDETVTMNDVGLQFLQTFGTPLALDIWKDFEAGTKSAAECHRIACATAKGINMETAIAMMESQDLREGFLEFTQLCKESSIDLRIVSDGFSVYIRYILDKHGLTHIPIWTNDVELADDGTLAAEFRNEREGCSRCASCKCALILTTSSDEDTVVYTGDGFSDHCPVRIADVVFARSDLKRQCGELGIPHHPFEDFHEVRAILENYLRDRPKYRREQAHRRRKELIMME